MRTEQRDRYAERIDRVVRFLEQRTDELAPDLAQLAAVASLSEYHFHRVYRLMTGETVGETIRRVRLARALPALRSGETVTDAMAASGYGTPQSFARALRAQTGASPTTARQQPALIEAALRKAKTHQGDREQAPALSIDITFLQPLRLLAIRNVGAYEALNVAYGRLFELVTEQLAPEASCGLYGVQYDDPRTIQASLCRAWAAVDTGGQGMPSGDLAELYVGGKSCLRARHCGNYDVIADSLDVLYAHALARTDRALADEPPFIHFLDDPEQVSEANLRADLYLPLEAE